LGDKRRQQSRDHRHHPSQSCGQRQVCARHSREHRDYGRERRSGEKEHPSRDCFLHSKKRDNAGRKCGHKDKIDDQDQADPAPAKSGPDLGVSKPQTNRA
jgi:hypothetical protein